MTLKKNRSGVNPDLERLLADLLKKVQRVVKTGTAEPVPNLMDIIRVVDRCMQWEKIKHNIKDEGWGSGFKDDEGAENE